MKKEIILSYAGILKNADLNSIKKIRKEARKDWNKKSYK